jgi:hypothetical protein
VTSGGRSTWPIVLFLGLCIALIIGSAVAVAAPSEGGRPWWHTDRPERVTGTVTSVDESTHQIVLDGLVSYDPVRAGIGVLQIDVPSSLTDAWGHIRAGDTIDVVVDRHDGGWRARSVVLLNPD